MAYDPSTEYVYYYDPACKQVLPTQNDTLTVQNTKELIGEDPYVYCVSTSNKSTAAENSVIGKMYEKNTGGDLNTRLVWYSNG